MSASSSVGTVPRTCRGEPDFKRAGFGMPDDNHMDPGPYLRTIPRMFEAVRTECGDDIQLLSGDDFTTYPQMAIGGVGCVSVVSNLDPQTMSELVAAGTAGDVERARRLHQKVQPLARMLFSEPNPVPTKVAASILGWCKPDVRAPLYVPSEDFIDLMGDIIEDYGLL